MVDIVAAESREFVEISRSGVTRQIVQGQDLVEVREVVFAGPLPLVVDHVVERRRWPPVIEGPFLVGNHGEQVPAGPDDTTPLTQRPDRICDVFYDVRAENSVVARVGYRPDISSFEDPEASTDPVSVRLIAPLLHRTMPNGRPGPLNSVHRSQCRISRKQAVTLKDGARPTDLKRASALERRQKCSWQRAREMPCRAPSQHSQNADEAHPATNGIRLLSGVFVATLCWSAEPTPAPE